jgi:phage terminase large subunit GpA-like protein
MTSAKPTKPKTTDEERMWKYPLLEGFRRAIRVDPCRTPIEWLEKHARFPHSSRSKAFQRDMAPWLNQIIEALFDPEVERVTVRAPTGGGKTTLIEAIVMYIVGVAPGPTMVVGQDDKRIEEWGETRMIKCLQATKPTSLLVPKSREKARKTSILFSHMELFLGGANMGSLQEKSMQYLIGDEVWRWAQGMIGQLKARHHDRWNGKLFLVSQGWEEGHEIDQSWNNGTQERWGFTCPECEEWQEWEWDQMKYDEVRDEDGDLDMEQTRQTARYACRHCQHEWEDSASNRRTLSTHCSYRQMNSKAYRGWRSFTWPAWGVWWIQWGELVREWIDAQKAKNIGIIEPLKDFILKRKADTWKENLLDQSSELITSGYSLAEYEQGETIDAERARSMQVDVQIDHFWCAIRGWRADGSSRLLYYSQVETWDLLRQIQGRYRVKDKLVLVDNQYGRRREEVYSKCIEYGWMAMHGSGKGFFTHRVKEYNGKLKDVKKLHSGMETYVQPGVGRCRYVFWASDPVKDVLAALLRREDGYFGIPDDAPSSYMKQITGEVKREVKDKQTGRMKVRWVKTHENHAWDCEAMAVAFGLMTGLLKVTRSPAEDPETDPREEQ